MSLANNTLSFLGAAETVTGSRYLIETPSEKVLIDCGMFQGFKALRLKNWERFPVDPRNIDKVLITHAHLDHSGYVPALVKHGFRGEILMTPGTFELCKIMWYDSAYLLKEEAERANRKGYSKHKPALALYDTQDVERALGQVKAVNFDTPVTVSKEITATFHHAGHILGAAQLVVQVNDKKLLFTGDLGRPHDPLMNPPAPYQEVDILVAESTYGNRSHPKTDPAEELFEVLSRTLERGGTVVIPAFAVGRSQSILLHIYRLFKSNRIPRVPLYLNSPMANSVTAIYEKYQNEHNLDLEEFNAMYDQVQLVTTVEESIALNEDSGSKIIIAASGMVTGGRVLHHIARFGTDPKNSIVLTGYQAGGTRGRALVNGEKSLRIFGRDVPINAEVVSIDTLSAHVDSEELIAWLKPASRAPAMTYLTHGEPEASDSLRFKIADQLHWPVRVVTLGETIDIDQPK